MGLLGVPGAAARRAQPVHHRDDVEQPGAGRVPGAGHGLQLGVGVGGDQVGQRRDELGDRRPARPARRRCVRRGPARGRRPGVPPAGASRTSIAGRPDGLRLRGPSGRARAPGRTATPPRRARRAARRAGRGDDVTMSSRSTATTVRAGSPAAGARWPGRVSRWASGPAGPCRPRRVVPSPPGSVPPDGRRRRRRLDDRVDEVGDRQLVLLPGAVARVHVDARDRWPRRQILLARGRPPAAASAPPAAAARSSSDGVSIPPKRITKYALAPPLASAYGKISFFGVFCSVAARSWRQPAERVLLRVGEVCEPDPANRAAIAANCAGVRLSAAAAWSRDRLARHLDEAQRRPTSPSAGTAGTAPAAGASVGRLTLPSASSRSRTR